LRARSLKEQLEKLKRNQERRLARKNQKLGIQPGQVGVGGKKHIKTETTRICGNCGQRGHMKTSRKLCPRWAEFNQVRSRSLLSSSAPLLPLDDADSPFDSSLLLVLLPLVPLLAPLRPPAAQDDRHDGLAPDFVRRRPRPARHGRRARAQAQAARAVQARRAQGQDRRRRRWCWNAGRRRRVAAAGWDARAGVDACCGESCAGRISLFSSCRGGACAGGGACS